MIRKISYWQAFILGVFIFVISLVIKFFVIDGLGQVMQDVRLQQLALQGSFILICVIGMLMFKGSKQEFGFRKPDNIHWKIVIFPALLLGAITSALVIFSPAKGMSLVKIYGFVNYIIFIWFVSSILEEIFVRGFIQSIIKNNSNGNQSVNFFKPGNTVLTTALLFGLMHATLFFKTDGLTAVIIMIMTFLLGIIAGVLRQKFNSLLPAIYSHICFNIGGLLGGIIASIILKTVTGSVPGQ